MTVRHLSLKLAALVAFMAAAVAIFLFLFGAAGGRLGLSQPYSAHILVPDGLQLTQGADVRRAGVAVGRVTGVGNRGTAGLVTIELDPDHAPLHRDATALVRTKTFLGESYVEVDPGDPRSGELPDGGTLPLDRAGEAVQLDEIFSAFDPPTRRRARANLRMLGGAVDGRGQELGRLLAAAQPTAVEGGAVIRVLAEQRAAVAALVDQSGELLGAIGDRSRQVRLLARRGKATAEAVAARDRALGRTIGELPGTLAQAEASVGRLAALSGRATPVVRDLRLGLRELAPVVETLRPAASETRALLGELPSVLRAADPMLASLGRFSGRARPAVGALGPALDELIPTLGYLGRFAPEVGSFFANFGAMLDATDARGDRLMRVMPLFSESSLAGTTPEMRDALADLFDLTGLSQVRGEGINPYPEPGTIGRPEPFTGTYPRLEPAR